MTRADDHHAESNDDTDDTLDDPCVVTRCVCFDVSFETLKAHAEAHHDSLHAADVDDLAETFGCTKGCGMCRPYIQRMLETGETRLPLIGGE